MTDIKERLRAGTEPLRGFVNIIPSPVATQAFAAAGADVVLLDQEHGPPRVFEPQKGALDAVSHWPGSAYRA
jgi:2-keto-3-deoxy-L-rhamnonate aldolase RhmA